MSKFGEISQKIISIKVSKKVYGQKSGQKCNYWRKFGQNRSLLLKMFKIGSFWGPKLRHMSKFGENDKIIFP